MERIIISKEHLYGDAQEAFNRTAIIIHVHYEDRLPFYIEFIKGIPNSIHVFFTTSNIRIREMLDAALKEADVSYSVIMKQNRGRDVSAFFVASREIVQKYEYVCFIHDKKEKDEAGTDRVKQWNYCLWENLLANDVFISNAIYTFENQANLGLMTPPPLISYDGLWGYINTWGHNYENTCKLLERLGVECVPDSEVAPHTIGTVFWVRTKAIDKLLKKEWKYEDFDEEPLASDGTISHALERSFEFVVRDAGYKMAWVYSDQYASEQLEFDTNALKECFDKMTFDYGVHTLDKLEMIKFSTDKLKQFAVENEHIYIYGAGLWGKRCYRMMISSEILPDAFVVSGSEEEGNYMGIPIIPLNKIPIDQASGFIIAMNEDKQEEIADKLFKRGIGENKILYFSKQRVM